MLPGLPDTPMYNAETVSRVDERPNAPSAARMAFDRFLQAASFGAFAMNNDGAYGWSVGYGNFDAARRAALSYCAAHGQKCRVIPERYSADLQGSPPANTLSYQQVQTYLAYPGKPRPAAFYVSLDGAYGAATGVTMREAVRKAREICQENMRADNGLKNTQCILRKAWI